MKMKLFAAVLMPLFLLSSGFRAYAQSNAGGNSQEDFKARYERLVARLGPSGVGVETLLDKWAAVDSSDVDLLTARFSYYFDKSRSFEVQPRTGKKYLGAEPLLTLKDSTGAPVYYYQVPVFDDSVFGKALRNMEKATLLYPERLDLRASKITALIAYEQEAPLLSSDSLLELISEYMSRKHSWTSPGVETVDDDLFCALVQEFCVSYFTIGTPEAIAALKKVSSLMLGHFRKNTDFLVDLGSCHMLEKDHAKALKYFDKALKIKPDCYPAIRNCSIYAMQTRNVKLMKKYLPMMVKYGPEGESASAKARLDSLK